MNGRFGNDLLYDFLFSFAGLDREPRRQRKGCGDARDRQPRRPHTGASANREDRDHRYDWQKHHEDDREVYDDWVQRLPERDDIESMLLQYQENFDQKKSRLSCQIKLSQDMDGLSLRVAPEE